MWNILLAPGTKVQMVVSVDDFVKLNATGADISRSFGGWATFDNVSSAMSNCPRC